MRTSRLLELFFGLATLVMAIEHYFVFDVSDISMSVDHGSSFNFIMFVLMFPAALTSAGSLVHTLWNYKVAAFVLLITGSAIFIIYYTLTFFGALYSQGGSLGALHYVLPAICGVATLVTATAREIKTPATGK